MQATFRISKKTYYKIGKQFALCEQDASFGAGAGDCLVRNSYSSEDEALSRLAVNGEELHIGFYKSWLTCGGSVYTIQREGEDYFLTFDDWRVLLNDYITLTSPLSEGEQLQLKFEDVPTKWINQCEIADHWPMSDPYKLCVYS